jgi:hypothetical protein
VQGERWGGCAGARAKERMRGRTTARRWCCRCPGKGKSTPLSCVRKKKRRNLVSADRRGKVG